MRRIVIIGNCGTGKSTLAAQLAGDLGLTHIELDQLFHGADWTPAPAEVFQSKLQAAIEHADATTDGWTTCGNYDTTSGGLNQAAADTIVWLDMPRWLAMKRVIVRTTKRAVTRQELWNGNREPLTNFYRWDPDQNIVRWTWTKHHGYREKNLRAMRNGTWDHATVHRLRSPREVAEFRAAARRV